MSTPDAALPRVFLNAGHDRRVAAGYPWAFSNELKMDAAARALPPGSLATLHRADGKALGVGTFNPHTLIAFRLFAREAQQPIDAGFFARHLERALALRQRLFAAPFYRLVHAEADGLPGLIADRFGDTLVLQLNTAGMERLRGPLLQAIESVISPQAIVLRNDTAMRRAEGLDAGMVEVVKGDVAAAVRVEEGACVFLADVMAGQKTGWFFDQRDNRAFAAALARGGALLDVYCYTGGFAIAAACAGAAGCLGIDASEPALVLAAKAAEANQVAERCSFRRGEAFGELEALANEPGRFRAVVCDPPAFVRSRKDLNTGLRAYRKLARLGAALVEPEGFLFIASCSHNVEPAALRGEVARGLHAAGRSGRIIRESGAAADHPVHPMLPETGYLKAFFLQLD
jgi:23S rRNA (cytosine1962-C5)-methyltransferase